MMESPERPETTGGWQPPEGAAGEWLPPIPPGAPPPGPPPGWRISPRAVDTAPDAPDGPPPWADPGNTQAGLALGLSVAAFGALFMGVFVILSLPLGVAGFIVASSARRRIQRGETRQGKALVDVALAVGIAATVLSLIVIVLVVASRS